MSRFYFKRNSGGAQTRMFGIVPPATLEMTVENVDSLHEVVSYFAEFLKGCGFIFEDLAVVEKSEDDE